ncbi:MAG: methionine adenosyltransferase [Terrimicrobiaceae bacterium]
MTAIIRETPIHEANESKVKSTGVAPLAPDKSVMDSSKRKRMSGIIVEEAKQTPVEEQRMEFVDLKGIGRSDSICDAITENVSIALCSEYLAAFGRILHYSVDKGLLIAGRTKPRLGGGSVGEPMRFLFGDRATAEYRGRRIDPGAIAEASAKKWIQRSLRFVDAERDVVFQSELKQGSQELTDLFEREAIGANDTSVAVGYAPMSETEENRYVKVRLAF